ncbi:hypothetical protein [Bradyrhizobium sp. CCBAU 53421]|uniref:hypothetical protein n=1 Tax=Bradyrhizobium sp. CCBAU 53421 TaxID=1325120 RepID=UPI001AEE3A0E|nr:hypothetical protein [Bradyrhizobium sp. CCBAU 53421]
MGGSSQLKADYIRKTLSFRPGACAATTDPLDEMLVRFPLSCIRDQLDSLLDEPADASLPNLPYERTIAEKEYRCIEMLPLAELAGFAFEVWPPIDPKRRRDLAASRWRAN